MHACIPKGGMAAIAQVAESLLWAPAGEPGHLLDRPFQRVAVVGVAAIRLHADDPVILGGAGHPHLATELIALVGFAPGDALNLGGMDAVGLFLVVSLAVCECARPGQAGAPVLHPPVRSCGRCRASHAPGRFSAAGFPSRPASFAGHGVTPLAGQFEFEQRIIMIQYLIQVALKQLQLGGGLFWAHKSPPLFRVHP